MGFAVLVDSQSGAPASCCSNPHSNSLAQSEGCAEHQKGHRVCSERSGPTPHCRIAARDRAILLWFAHRGLRKGGFAQAQRHRWKKLHCGDQAEPSSYQRSKRSAMQEPLVCRLPCWSGQTPIRYVLVDSTQAPYSRPHFPHHQQSNLQWWHVRDSKYQWIVEKCLKGAHRAGSVQASGHARRGVCRAAQPQPQEQIRLISAFWKNAIRY